ncbi:hypothetical protein ACPX19_08460 [Winogradskyella sp. HB-48]|uniref:hypothetical protein n=1 Tax=Winogradskyella sp. HB-48 TaxID=3416808 RepID=UPI003CEAEEC4
MRKAEKILGGLIIVLMISRLIFTYPFSSILISLSCILLSLLYLFFGFAVLNNIRFRDILKKESYKGISALRILLTFFTGLILSMLIIYMLFKFQRWPYGQYGLMISLILLAFIGLIVLVKYFISKNKFYSNYLIRLLTFGIYGLLLFFISSENLLELKYKNFPDYIEAEKKLMKDPQNRQLQIRANKERQKMDLSKD